MALRNRLCKSNAIVSHEAGTKFFKYHYKNLEIIQIVHIYFFLVTDSDNTIMPGDEDTEQDGMTSSLNKNNGGKQASDVSFCNFT